uniref:Melibiase n=1 Tax=uncultured Lactobacillus sp. TaxID=153152 RepID=A0A060CBL3_9LACO|nr:melibiase [uncultured Lactobacillus sp.]
MRIFYSKAAQVRGRFDAGWAYYMPQSWTSDNTDAIARLTIQYGTSLAYPVSTMTAHVSAIPNHQTGRKTPLATRGAVAMSGVLGMNLTLLK